MHTKLIVGVTGAIIAIILIIALLTIALINVRANLTPEEVTGNFLRGWARVAAEGDSPIAENLHRQSTYVTETFGDTVEQKAERATTTDPVFCLPEPTGNVSVGVARVSSESDRASLTVEAHPPEGVPQPLDVVLVRREGGWKIDEIDCGTVIEGPQIG